MSVYMQQINNMVEQLPVSEQQFIVEFIKKISANYTTDINKKENKPMPLKQAINRFIDNISTITDEPLDDEFDEIVRDRIKKLYSKEKTRE